MVIGIGSGTTILYSVQRLAELVNKQKWQLKFVPTSYQVTISIEFNFAGAQSILIEFNFLKWKALHLIKQYGLALTDLESNSQLNVCIDGADEVDEQLVLIKGGGGCLTQEKIVASASERLIIVADYRKRSKALGTLHDLVLFDSSY